MGSPVTVTAPGRDRLSFGNSVNNRPSRPPCNGTSHTPTPAPAAVVPQSAAQKRQISAGPRAHSRSGTGTAGAMLTRPDAPQPARGAEGRGTPGTGGMLSTGRGCGNGSATTPARSLFTWSYCRAEIVLGKKIIKLRSLPSSTSQHLPPSWRRRERSAPKPC